MKVAKLEMNKNHKKLRSFERTDGEKWKKVAIPTLNNITDTMKETLELYGEKVKKSSFNEAEQSKEREAGKEVKVKFD